MNKFKVGDLLVGTKNSPYEITNQCVIVKVLYNDGENGGIYVRVVKLHPSASENTKQLFESNHWMGFEDWVSSKFFKLYKDADYYYDPEQNKFGFWDNGEGLIRV